MTGFGTKIVEREGVRLRATIRSVNSRHLDIQIRSPHFLQQFEPKVRERVQTRARRGKLSLTLEWEEMESARALPTLDEDVARAYLDELQRLAELTGKQSDPVDLSTLVQLTGVFKVESKAMDLELAEAMICDAVDAALDDFEASRRAEGDSLDRDLRKRVDLLEQHAGRIAEMSAATPEHIRLRLREKVDALLRPGQIDEDRLAMEVVMLAERSDITEEIVRLRSHNDQFRAALDKGGEVGRRLNFLLQEMNREANTMGSKSQEADLTHQVVEVKEEIERLREQIQNLA
jgi:uncharacterized protein (TIGR00255 family)